MTPKNNFVFPCPGNLELIRKHYADINAADSFAPVQKPQAGVWRAEVHCSCGKVLEKAGLAMVELTGGTVEGAAVDITLLQTLAWPANPCLPGLIIMASTSKMEDQGIIVTFYTDLIIQSGLARQEDKDLFAAALATACDRHGQSLDEYQAFLAGRGMLGNCAAECGLLYFYEESDAALLADIMQSVLQAYQQIVTTSGRKPSADDVASMQSNRKAILEWMLTQDYGVKVARQNGMPLEVLETYGFPPRQG